MIQLRGGDVRGLLCILSPVHCESGGQSHNQMKDRYNKPVTCICRKDGRKRGVGQDSPFSLLWPCALYTSSLTLCTPGPVTTTKLVKPEIRSETEEHLFRGASQKMPYARALYRQRQVEPVSFPGIFAMTCK